MLFLDEMAEFSRHVLEVLRQPLEEGCVRIARAARTVAFPARFMLIGAMNPCPCGYHGDDVARRAGARRCRSRATASRLSGPLRDRMDLTVAVTALPARELSGSAGGETSAAIRGPGRRARDAQMARDGG